MQLCNAHGLPLVSLCDTPGFMVGPEIEAQAQVRHVCRMFMVAAHLRVPYLRGGAAQGLRPGRAGDDGAAASMRRCSRSHGRPASSARWDSKARCGWASARSSRRAAEGAERDALFKKLVAQQYANGEAINMAQTLEIDAVIDPAETRAWLVRGLASATRKEPAGTRYVDTW